MRRIRKELLEELFWILVIAAHAGYVTLIWNEIVRASGGRHLTSFCQSLIILFVFGSQYGVPDQMHWTDCVIACVRTYVVAFVVLITLYLLRHLL